MYLRILQKDLKRKKTMNIILLIFIILATIFIASSVNNLISISSAMKSYFEKAELKDYMIITVKEEKNDTAIADFLDQESNVESWVVDENVYLTNKNITANNGRNFVLPSIGMISSFNLKQQKFFDSNNNEITKINDGEIYMPIKAMEDNDLKVGDVITIGVDDFSLNLTITDSCKDAFLGSTMMGFARFIVSDNNYNKIKSQFNFKEGQIYSINTSNLDQLEHDYNQMGFNVIVSADQKLISKTYIMDMMLAALLLVVSTCLILIAMVILRFTIVFTLNEEFREIGIMKAIGIKGRKIRNLYIIKYIAISLIGSVIGFFISIPFGNIFIEKASKNIIIAGKNSVWLNFIFSALIIFIVVLFCYTCTRHINKSSPIEAIRNGSNGERFKRKGFLRLRKSKLSTSLFLAFNDILSEPKKFAALILTFTIGTILIIVPVNTINTLKSDQLVTWFAMAKSDVYLTNEGKQYEFITSGHEYLKNYLAKMQQKLKDNGIDASVYCEMSFKYSISLDGYGFNSLAIQGTGITADQYTYTKGEPPEYDNEVALTYVTADKIGADIGDTVKINTGETDKEYIVTAIYQAMTNMGEGIRFSEKETLNYEHAYGSFAIQIRYNDNPSKKVVEKRFEIMNNLFPDFKVSTGGKYISTIMGNIAGQLDSVKQIILAVIIVINMLVAVLMVKTFIAKEKGEIGMLKSVGFNNPAIEKWQVLRIGIVLLISTILAALLSNPIAEITIGKIFVMMGASHIEFAVKPLEVYVIYPLIIFILTISASGITALQINKISTQETNNIE